MMGCVDPVSHMSVPETNDLTTAIDRLIPHRVRLAIYALVVAISVSVWFVAIRSPLTVDETGSYWQIRNGLSGVPFFQSLSFPAYSYILWLCSRVLGTSEVALRIPSLIAIFGAAYLLFRIARKLFDLEIASFIAVVYCLHPIVMFASIDVRPYAFGALAINSCIFAILCLRQNDTNWLAVLTGILAACIVYFHFLFVVLLPSLAICFLLVKGHAERNTIFRQMFVAVGSFLLAVLPTVPGMLYTFETRSNHVYYLAPTWRSLAMALAPGWLIPLALLIAFIAAALRSLDFKVDSKSWRAWFCLALGPLPILLLYGVSISTPIHIFLERYCLVGITGIALCWGVFANCVRSRTLALVFCLLFVATGANYFFRAPEAKHHLYTWKYALEAVEKNASVDGAPVFLCSEFVESSFSSMPVDSPKESILFAPISYYRLSVPVVPLPQRVNEEANRVASDFLQRPGARHRRFLAAAYEASYPSLQWLAQQASGTHSAKVIGIYDGVAVVEFNPLPW